MDEAGPRYRMYGVVLSWFGLMVWVVQGVGKSVHFDLGWEWRC